MPFFNPNFSLSFLCFVTFFYYFLATSFIFIFLLYYLFFPLCFNPFPFIKPYIID
ncbi:hypothetical protein Lalb_Chr09g0327291 [Lupinus albus]|uniref:Uncharacterized protein n=1 Tax=Lupinus albus TaxID=3870 RepID=A0A6A4PZF0_LUPAL|nr:hypothetical protein Lalb_Chr09g0327291 [Lupinus albus]